MRDQEVKTDKSPISSRWILTCETFYQEVIGGTVECLKGDKLSRAMRTGHARVSKTSAFATDAHAYLARPTSI